MKEALDEFIKECIDKCACYYDKDKICEDCEIVQESRGCDSEAAPELRLEKQGRGTLYNLRRENGIYAEQTQVGIYKAVSEEGASTTQTPQTEGPPPASGLQIGNTAR